MLILVHYPFTDSQILSFARFTEALAGDILINKVSGYRENIKNLIDSLSGLSLSEKEPTLLYIDSVLKILAPSEFIYWMQSSFNIIVQKGMSYDPKTCIFEYE